MKISFEEKIEKEISDEFLEKIKQKGYEVLILEENIFLKKNLKEKFLEGDFLRNINQNLESYLKFYIEIKEIVDLSKELVIFI